MKVAVTGTPGTGKTTVANLVDADLDVVHLNDVIKSEGFSTGTDEERDSLVADMDAVTAWFDDRDDVLVESHLAHNLPVDRVVVLRCHPEELATRLRDRGEPEAKAEENAESEALDIVLSEAAFEHGRENIYEIDTTDRSPDAVAADVERVIEGEREPSAGEVNFIDYV